ncbi:MAG: hypothetical protein JO250_02225 [Armatimonadetes bacterium]|nr:hypothetical protein [Armatimonadota bacterium]
MTRLRAFPVQRFTLALGVALAAMAFFVYIAHEVAEGGTRRAEAAVHQYFSTHQNVALHAVMVALSLATSGATNC